MKRVIRRGVFETNSSSTHVMSIMLAEDFNKWSNGDLYYFNPWNYNYEIEHYYLDKNYQPLDKHLYTKEEVKNFLLHRVNIEPSYFNFESDESGWDDFEDMAYDYNFVSIRKFEGEMETDTETFVTPHGDRVMIIKR